MASVLAPRFEIPACPEVDVRRLRGELGVSGLVAQVLVRRGLGDPGRARAFLDASEEHPTSSSRIERTCPGRSRGTTAKGTHTADNDTAEARPA